MSSRAVDRLAKRFDVSVANFWSATKTPNVVAFSRNAYQVTVCCSSRASRSASRSSRVGYEHADSLRILPRERTGETAASLRGR